MFAWGQPEHWEFPDPAEGLPVPHPAPPPNPHQRRAETLEFLRRQTIIDRSTVYLPNGQGEADELHETFGLDLSRTVVVPNAVADLFFEATPEAFVAQYGLRDFVLCAARQWTFARISSAW